MLAPATRLIIASAVVASTAAVAQLPMAVDAFRFSSAYGDSMVLQSAPQQAVVWGMSPFDDDDVTVHFQGKPIKATMVLYGGNSTWRATLPSTPASLTESYNISATSSKSGSVVTLSGVLFGDVWVCSGEFSYLECQCLMHIAVGQGSPTWLMGSGGT